MKRRRKRKGGARMKKFEGRGRKEEIKEKGGEEGNQKGGRRRGKGKEKKEEDKKEDERVERGIERKGRKMREEERGQKGRAGDSASWEQAVKQTWGCGVCMP